MNICEDFKTYGIAQIHVKASSSFDDLSWIPVTHKSEPLSTEAHIALDEGIRELFDDISFTEGDYDFMAGYLTVEDDVVVFHGSQSREVTLTKSFGAAVLH